MRGSWRRWWPLGKPKKLSPGQLELRPPNTDPATELPPDPGTWKPGVLMGRAHPSGIWAKLPTCPAPACMRST